MKPLLAVNCRELTRDTLFSMRTILMNAIPRLSADFRLLLFSDIPLEESVLRRIGASAGDNLYRGGQAVKGWSHWTYYRWMGRVCAAVRPDFFWEVNHNITSDMGGAVKLAMIHDFYTLYGMQRIPLATRAKRRVTVSLTRRHADIYITPSRVTAEDITRIMRIGPGRISVIPIGLGTIPDSGERRPADLPEGGFIFNIGRQCHWKGSDLLLKAAGSSAFPRGVNLVLAGRPEREFEPTLNAAAKRGGNIVYLGQINDAEREYLFRHAKLFVYPTRFDGFGMPPLEAAQRGCPSLVSDIPIMREVTAGNALFFDLESGADGLARAIADNIDKPHDRLVSESLSHVRQYNWDNFAASLATVLLSRRAE